MEGVFLFGLLVLSVLDRDRWLERLSSDSRTVVATGGSLGALVAANLTITLVPTDNTDLVRPIAIANSDYSDLVHVQNDNLLVCGAIELTIPQLESDGRF